MKHTNNLLKGFTHAYSGFTYACRERNVRFHLAATICVLIAASMLPLSPIEWAFILSAIAFVLVAEFLNTSIEMLCDVITRDYSIPIKKIKDIAAASVLLSALYALAIAFLILYPKLLNLYLSNLLYI
ncbi:diacylglycerol kinase family protein [Cytophaga aurantiaca]|uniref:diacylglycerol kinase family protein n=1 Tax=Cytophaga aurantiaca TaxID=29530 RepID=UPI00035C6DA7|nr:diacylglycerol kinase family protein [Cytophaga aurantiaca]